MIGKKFVAVALTITLLSASGCLLRDDKTVIKSEYDVMLKKAGKKTAQLKFQLDKQNRILKKQYARMELQRAVYYERLEKETTLVGKVTEVTNALNTRKTELTARQQEDQAITKQVSELNAHVAALQTRLPELKKEFDLMAQGGKLDDLNQKLVALQQQTAAKEAELVKANQAAAEQMAQKKVALDASLVASQNALAQKQAEIDNALTDHQNALAAKQLELDNKIKEMQAVVAAREADARVIQDQLAKLDAEYLPKKTLFDQQTAQIADFDQAMAEQEQKLAAIDRALASRRAEVTALEKTLDETTKAVSIRRSEMESAQADANTIENKTATAQAKLTLYRAGLDQTLNLLTSLSSFDQKAKALLATFRQPAEASSLLPAPRPGSSPHTPGGSQTIVIK